MIEKPSIPNNQYDPHFWDPWYIKYPRRCFVSTCAWFMDMLVLTLDALVQFVLLIIKQVRDYGVWRTILAWIIFAAIIREIYLLW